MILVIEDKDDPTASIAAEVDGPEGVELACIPAVAVRLEGDPPQLRLAFQIGRMGFEWREGHKPQGGPSSKTETALLVEQYMKALEHSGSSAVFPRAKDNSKPPAQFSAVG